jgi:hypothetical protein
MEDASELRNSAVKSLICSSSLVPSCSRVTSQHPDLETRFPRSTHRPQFPDGGQRLLHQANAASSITAVKGRGRFSDQAHYYLSNTHTFDLRWGGHPLSIRIRFTRLGDF